MKKVLKVGGIVVGVILFLAASFIGVWFLWPWHAEFYKNAQAEFAIPGLKTDFVPQAFTKVDNQNLYIIGGYMNDGSASRYYIVDGESKEVKNYFTLTIEGDDYVGHACGIASHGNNLWTCSNDGEGGKAYRFLLSDVLNSKDGESVEVVDSFLTNNGADNIMVGGNYLWIGEFYREGNYETDASHHIETRTGETNTAVAFAYELNESGVCGVADFVPDKAISTIGLVQGVAITDDGNIILSTSYSLPASTIYCYKNVLTEEKHSTIEVGEHNVDLWFLDGESLLNEVSAPAMTEEIVAYNGKLYILSESACKKYRLFTRDSVKEVYSMSLDYIKGDAE